MNRVSGVFVNEKNPTRESRASWVKIQDHEKDTGCQPLGVAVVVVVVVVPFWAFMVGL